MTVRNKYIVAILGLPGSGKSAVMDYLMKTHGWPKIYFGDVTFDEMRRLGLEINEKNERRVREGLRKEFGELCYAERVARKILQLEKSPIILLESMYSWSEYLFLRNEFGEEFRTVAVYASPEKRYARLEKRKVRPLDNAEARSRDHSQIENLSQAGPIAMADYLIINEGSRDELYDQVDRIIESCVGSNR